MHVADLQGSTNIKGRSGKWEAFVTVTVASGDASTPVENATVTGDWSGAISGTDTGSTASDGTVTFASGDLRGDSVTFTVTDVTHSTLNYDSSNNNESSLTLNYSDFASGLNVESSGLASPYLRGDSMTSPSSSLEREMSQPADPIGGNGHAFSNDLLLLTEPRFENWETEEPTEPSLVTGVDGEIAGAGEEDLYEWLAIERVSSDADGADSELSHAKATDLALELFQT